MHVRHVFSLQYLHSKMNQCGPEWQMLQSHWIRLDSDLMSLKEWMQWVGTAMVGSAVVWVCQWGLWRGDWDEGVEGSWKETY